MENITSTEIMIAQKREIAGHRDTVYEIRRKLRIYRQNLNAHWQGLEMQEVNKNVEEAERNLNRIIERLDDLERMYLNALKVKEAEDGL